MQFPLGGGSTNNGNPSFTLAASAPSLTVAAGNSATDTINITDGGGFTGPVTLAAAGAPAGVTVTFATNPATSSSVVTVSAASTAAAGTFTLTISGSGTSGGTALTGSTPIAVTIPPPNNTGGACHIGYTITNQWTPGFQVALSIDNTSTTAINGWTLGWTFPNGQTVTQLWNGAETQSGSTVTVKNLNYNASIPAKGSYKDAGFTGTWSGTNGIPTAFTLNGAACTVN